MPQRLILLALFFCSGACGLIYQVLWLRELSLVFGVTTYAASTVLAAFMGGLAVGSLLAERVAARSARPLMLFGVAEILIGISALVTPLGLSAAQSVYMAASRAWPDQLALLTLARLACSSMVLFVPTVLMGLTLPLLSSSALVRGSRLGARMSALYAVNAAGAVIGSIVGGFYLIGGIGMQASFLLAAAVNVAVGLGAFVLDRGVAAAPADAPVSRSTDAAPDTHIEVGQPIRRAVLVVSAVSGFASLALEIVWFRVLLQFLPATTYAFTTMVATVLTGIAVGGAIAARVLSSPRDWSRLLATVLLSTGAAVVVSLTFLSWSYNAGWDTGGMVQAAAAAIFPAALAMGIAFPMVLRLAAVRSASEAGDSRAVARGVGVVYALNVAGAICGALAGGFLVLPALGSRTALIVLAALYPAAAMLVLAARRSRPSAGALVAAAIFVIGAVYVPDPFETAIARRHGIGYREMWREEGAQTAVSVQNRGTMRVLFLDGLHQANDTYDMVTLHRRIGSLPMVLHPNPKDVLVIGLGGGATAGAVSQFPDATVQVVELSDSVIAAARLFAHVNYDVLRRPNVRMRHDDGRNFLLLTGQTFDVITADIIQPEHAGAGSLYSREYFTLVRDALKHDGLVLQWIGQRPARDYKLIMRTFLDVFPNATLWLNGSLMVGSKRPFHLDPDALSRRRSNPVTARALDEIGLTDDATLRSWYTGGPNEMRHYVGGGPLLTDDRPLLEYHRSLSDDRTEIDYTALRGDVSQILR